MLNVHDYTEMRRYAQLKSGRVAYVEKGGESAALFLRGFYAANDLRYDANGKVDGSPKSTDWTLAAFNCLKAEREGPDQIELEGVRAPELGQARIAPSIAGERISLRR